jgi:hypothetical protein
VLEGPVTQTGKRPRLNRTITDRTGLAVLVLPVVALVRSMVQSSHGEQENRSRLVTTGLELNLWSYYSNVNKHYILKYNEGTKP